MPELPEVEVVRRGLDRFVTGRTIASVSVRHPRAVRAHPAGAANFAARLTGRRIDAARRRGKYLWLPLDSGEAVLAHLGMSGQLLVRPPEAAYETHLRVRIGFADGGPELRFVDQRTFGVLAVEPLVPASNSAGNSPGKSAGNSPGNSAGASRGTSAGTSAGVQGVPRRIVHIARDPFDPDFDDASFIDAVRRRRTVIKRALLDQSLVSGIGNIYADEALWRARLHHARPTGTLTRGQIRRLLAAVRDVMGDALARGGTSFDSLYVNVDGESGFFDRSLAVYGRAGEPCPRCGRAIRREPFMNRSSYTCPRCQPRPRPRDHEGSSRSGP